MPMLKQSLKKICRWGLLSMKRIPVSKPNSWRRPVRNSKKSWFNELSVGGLRILSACHIILHSMKMSWSHIKYQRVALKIWVKTCKTDMLKVIPRYCLQSNSNLQAQHASQQTSKTMLKNPALHWIPVWLIKSKSWLKISSNSWYNVKFKQSPSHFQWPPASLLARNRTLSSIMNAPWSPQSS